jgi:hypothetical protein
VGEHDFSDDVAAYVAACGVADGYLMLPPILSFANFPFSKKLIENMGEDAIGRQARLMDVMKGGEELELPEEDVAQLLRLTRCNYHVQAMIDGAST